MSETALTPTSSAPAPTPSSTPPGGTTTSATPPAAPTPVTVPVTTPQPSAKDFRFPASEDVEPWARGKTAEEVLAIARNYHDAFNRGSVPTPQPPPQAAPAAVGAPIADDTIITGRELREYLNTAAQQYIAPQLRQTAEIAASGVFGLVKQQYPREFSKYGPEIQVELSKIPRQLWTLDNLDTVVTLVAGRHREDYARERAQELVAQMEPTIRPTGGGSGPVPTPEAKAQSLESDSIRSEERRVGKECRSRWSPYH